VTGRGRPPKWRPAPGAPLARGMSLRDVEAATGVNRRTLARALLVASIPSEEFEALVEAEDPATVAQLELLARGRAKKKTSYTRRCPHCGGVLGTEGTR